MGLGAGGGGRRGTWRGSGEELPAEKSQVPGRRGDTEQDPAASVSSLRAERGPRWTHCPLTGGGVSVGGLPGLTGMSGVGDRRGKHRSRGTSRGERAPQREAAGEAPRGGTIEGSGSLCHPRASRKQRRDQGRRMGDKLTQWDREGHVRPGGAGRPRGSGAAGPRAHGPSGWAGDASGGVGWPGLCTVPFRNAGRQRKSWRSPTGGPRSRNQGPLHRLQQDRTCGQSLPVPELCGRARLRHGARVGGMGAGPRSDPHEGISDTIHRAGSPDVSAPW